MPGPERDEPSLEELNAFAAGRGIVTGSGVPLRFVRPADDDADYEKRAYLRGEVATRAGNRHDLFNALVWLAFPLSKAVINRRHCAAFRSAQARGATRRGALRDALTQFDECGVVVLGSQSALWEDIRRHLWRKVFVDRRDDLVRTTRFLVFGHASHDALGAPFIGLCGKALFLDVDDGWFLRPPVDQIADADARLACFLGAADLTPRDLQPLPLLGIPGATPENQVASYYEDERQFRPPRRMSPGSPPGNR